MKPERLSIRSAADVRAQNSIPLASRYTERSTYDLLQASAADHAERPALTFLMRGTLDEEPVVYRYREFFARITQAANAFNRLGLGAHETVAYLLPIIGPALSWPDAVMGISPFWHLGAVPIEAFDLSVAVTLVAIGAVAAAVGTIAFERRDLVGA